MVIDFILILFGAILGALGSALPQISIWPDSVLNAVYSIFSSIGGINFILPIDTLFFCINLFIQFCVYYYGVKLLVSIFNFLRGSGEIKIK